MNVTFGDADGDTEDVTDADGECCCDRIEVGCDTFLATSFRLAGLSESEDARDPCSETGLP